MVRATRSREPTPDGRRSPHAARRPDDEASDTCRDLETFAGWLRRHGARGYVGEVGWPARDPAEAAEWNELGDAWYRAADAERLWVTGLLEEAVDPLRSCGCTASSASNTPTTSPPTLGERAVEGPRLALLATVVDDDPDAPGTLRAASRATSAVSGSSSPTTTKTSELVA